jgi:transcriptional regulator GlxA family with amidase domain
MVFGLVMAVALAASGATAPDASEHAQTIAALAAPKRTRPLVAVLGLNDGTETTDYLVPYAVLREAGIFDVVALATSPGPLALMPALTVRPQETIAEFDARAPDGADYVIVPAMHRPDDPDVAAWIREQAAKGATIVGVCDGALVLAAAGLLDGRRATGHWYSTAGLQKRHPTMRWVPDRRYVADRGVATTTGVTASIPISLALVEAVGGRAQAETVARELGVGGWNAAHESGAYRLTARHVATAAANLLAVWSHETIGVPVDAGVDEIALALTADAWSRTWRSQAVTVAATRSPLTTRRGLTLVPDREAGPGVCDHMLAPVQAQHPARALDASLDDLAHRYGQGTVAFVALQLEYPAR